MSKCKICGSNKNIERHHINYKKDKTIPLCESCHIMVHRDANHKYYPEDVEASKDSLKIKCPRCNRIWKYTGKNNITATCPDCRKIIKIEKNRVKGGQTKNEDRHQ